MASFEMDGLDSLISELTSIEIDEIAPKMLEESASILEANIKKRTEFHNRTGSMAASIKTTKAKATKDGYSICVRPTGTDKKGVRNMEKMVYMEYGTYKQNATPILTPATRESEEEVCEKMQEVFNREVGAE